jgi:hypothetical protein
VIFQLVPQRKTTLGHIAVPAAEKSPEPVQLHPSSEYDKMESPLRSPSEISLNYRFVRLGQFFEDLYDLPWVATRITADYVPGGQSREKHRHRTCTTWYPDQQSPIDLLAGGRYTSRVVHNLSIASSTLTLHSHTSTGVQTVEVDHFHITDIGVDFLHTHGMPYLVHNILFTHMVMH